MTRIKSAYLWSVLCCILFASTFLISDVSARSTRSTSHHSSGHSSHSGHSGHSGSSSHHSYPSAHSSGALTQHKSSQLHSYPTSHSGGTSGSSSHSYPSSPSHSLSGGSSGSSGHSYPSSNSLSGSGYNAQSKPYTPTHFGGSSGSSVHNYPPSNSLSGSGNFGGSSGSSGHSYPSSNSLSGSVRQPGSGSSGSSVHSYSSSNSFSGSGGRFGSTSKPSMNYGGNSGSSVHSYPSTNTLSGSGSRNHGNTYTTDHHITSWGSNQPVHKVHHTHSRTVIHHHHHYDYSPPTVINYRSSYGTPISYPVYRGVPPPYVYEYRSSGNKYSHLLAGLALYNLGRVSANSNSHHYHEHYIPQPDEQCKFGVQYKTGNFEEMAIDCRAITYFIYETQPQTQTHVTKNVFNMTIVTTQAMLPNGTLVSPANAQSQNPMGNGPLQPAIQPAMQPTMQAQFNSANMSTVVPNIKQVMNSLGQDVPTTQNFNNMNGPGSTNVQAEYNAAIAGTQQMLNAFGQIMPNTQHMNTNMQGEFNAANAFVPNTQQMLNSVGQVVPNTQQFNTVTTTSTQVVSVTDPRLSGKLVQVNPDMECYVTRTTRNSNMKKDVPCDLLQEYSSSLRKNSAAMVKSSLTVIMVAVAYLLYLE